MAAAAAAAQRYRVWGRPRTNVVQCQVVSFEVSTGSRFNPKTDLVNQSCGRDFFAGLIVPCTHKASSGTSGVHRDCNAEADSQEDLNETMLQAASGSFGVFSCTAAPLSKPHPKCPRLLKSTLPKSKKKLSAQALNPKL